MQSGGPSCVQCADDDRRRQLMPIDQVQGNGVNTWGGLSACADAVNAAPGSNKHATASACERSCIQLPSPNPPRGSSVQPSAPQTFYACDLKQLKCIECSGPPGPPDTPWGRRVAWEDACVDAWAFNASTDSQKRYNDRHKSANDCEARCHLPSMPPQPPPSPSPPSPASSPSPSPSLPPPEPPLPPQSPPAPSSPPPSPKLPPCSPPSQPLSLAMQPFFACDLSGLHKAKHDERATSVCVQCKSVAAVVLLTCSSQPLALANKVINIRTGLDSLVRAYPKL